jgi:hypothetical protein
MNCLLKLTHRQLEVFGLLVDHEIYSTDKSMNYSKLRKKIMSTTSINRHNLTKYVKIFETKQLVITQGRNKEIIINKDILPIITNNEITIQFKLNV